MLRQLVITTVLLVVLAGTGCATVTSSVADNQPCPTWTGYVGNCDIKVVKDSVMIDSGAFYFEGYDKARVVILNNDVVVNDAQNVLVYTESNELVDHTTVRLKGTYIFTKVDMSKEAQFEFQNTRTDVNATYLIEFATQTKTE